jgi:hypothetical protein
MSTQTSSQGLKYEDGKQLELRTESCTDRELSRKRKCSKEVEQDLPSPLRDQPTQKRARVPQLDKAAEDAEEHIDHWVETGHWSESFFENKKMGKKILRKRPPFTSYTQSIKDDDSAEAYTIKYEEVLEKAGIFMYAYQSPVAISDACQQLCNNLLSGEYEAPKNSLFQDDRFWTVFRRLLTRNKPRVFRDITPLIVPSAELLYINGNHHLEHLVEEVNGVWTKCTTLAGPHSKPDFAVGFMSSAFTEEEILKLKSYSTPDRATLFTEEMYFPFLVCEAKDGD